MERGHLDKSFVILSECNEPKDLPPRRLVVRHLDEDRFRRHPLALWLAAFCVLGTVALHAQDTPAPTAETTIPTPSVAAAPAAPTPAAALHLLYPSSNLGTSSNPPPAAPPSAASLLTTFLVLAGLCAGGYYFLRRHPGFSANFKGGARKLVLSESRPLGNRQFLVVVEYENERMLLGVTPGKIDYLCPLRGSPGEPAPFSLPKE